MTEPSLEHINAVINALRPHFNPDGIVHLDLAVARLNMVGLQQELREARADTSVDSS